MGATLQQRLPHDSGIGLPTPVHQALRELGAACNAAAVAVNQACALQLQAMNNREMLTSKPQSSCMTAVAVDLERVADRFYEQTLVVLARAATPYAVYASQVAVEVVAGNPAPPPGSETLKPSDLIAALGFYLPPVHFVATGDSRVVDEQNATIGASYQALTQVITHQIRGENAFAYDDPAAVAAEAAAPVGVSAALPEALHCYAATLTWAVGVVTGIEDGDDAGPVSVA